MATFEPMEVPTTYGVTYMSEVYVAGFCTISISVLIVYEYIITIADEVRHFWHGRFTGSKILFFMNRYALLSHGVLSLGTTVSLNTAGCADATVLLSFCIFILYATEAVFAAMRAFAITGYNWPTALFVLALGSIPVWTNVYLITRTRYFVERFGNVVACANTLDVSADSYFTDHIPAYYSAIIVGALGSILSDALVLVITWWKLWGFKRAADRARVSTPLVAVILRDGSLYFVALAALNIVQTLVQIYAKDTAYFLTPLPAVCISRFLFDLHSKSGSSVLATTASELETVHSGSLHIAPIGRIAWDSESSVAATKAASSLRFVRTDIRPMSPGYQLSISLTTDQCVSRIPHPVPRDGGTPALTRNVANKQCHGGLL